MRGDYVKARLQTRHVNARGFYARVRIFSSRYKANPGRMLNDFIGVGAKIAEMNSLLTSNFILSKNPSPCQPLWLFSHASVFPIMTFETFKQIFDVFG